MFLCCEIKRFVRIGRKSFSHIGGSQQDYSSDPQLLSFLAEESAKRGFVLVPRTTTPPPDQSIRGTKNEKGAFSDRDCTEKRILRLKYARTSFPSLCASVTMYATVFVAVYITHMLRYLRKTCFCIPLSLLLGGCLANVFLGLGRVVYRENWLEDVIAGWGVGLLIAGYVLYRSLHSKQKSSVTTAAEIRRQLNQIQSLLQSNHEYRHNEVKYMKYL
ncbi:unnamed protein product [Dicrocoelium dendriticum]|nr:unnamed protein product [Dicrocoelium dendriticum]